MYEQNPQKKLSARVRKSHIEGLKIPCNAILITWLQPQKSWNIYILETIITRIAGLPAMLYYKDNGLSLLTLIYIYIYFNILFSYLNAAHSAVLVSQMIRYRVAVERMIERERIMHLLEA